MIVDFVGLPGAGKSTLARAVAASLQRAGHDAIAGENDGGTTVEGHPVRGWARRRFRVASLVGNPKLVAACASLAVGREGRSLLPMFVNLCRRDRALRGAKPAGVLLLHESSLHRLCIALALTGHTAPRIVDRFLRGMAWPDAVVYLEVTQVVAARRVFERLARIDPALAELDANVPTSEGWRERYALVAERVVAAVGRSIPVLLMDGSRENVPSLAHEVRAWVAELPGNRGTGVRAGGSGTG